MKLFIFAACLVVCGCSGLHYYDLYVQPEQGTTGTRIGKVLQVDDIRCNETFWRQQIAYRKTSYRIQYFSFIHWAKSPGELIQDAVIQYFRNSHSFARVTDEYSGVEADLVMKTHIDAMEMVFKGRQWYARLALDIEIVAEETEKTILNYHFDRTLAIAGRSPRHLPEKISRILQEELDKLLTTLSVQVNRL